MVDEPKKEEKKLSAKVEKLVAEIAELSVLELSDLVSALQEKLGVQAAPAAPAAPAAAQTPGGVPTGGEAVPGATGAAGGPATQTVVLTGAGENKIGVIKALRQVNPNLGLKDAKDMTEKLPAEIVKDVKAEEAAAAKQKLEAAGATVELK